MILAALSGAASAVVNYRSGNAAGGDISSLFGADGPFAAFARMQQAHGHGTHCRGFGGLASMMGACHPFRGAEGGNPFANASPADVVRMFAWVNIVAYRTLDN